MNDQRYTQAEVDKLIASGEADVVDEAPPLNIRQTMRNSEKDLGYGALYALESSARGLEQLWPEALGGQSAQQSAAGIQEMEKRYAPNLNTLSGKIGNLAGVVGQFMVPGGIAGEAIYYLPKALKVVNALAGKAGSVRRAATTAGMFEAAQPIEKTSPIDVGIGKAVHGAGGALLGGAVSKVGRLLSPSTARSAIPPERQAMVNEALRRKMTLTPGMETNDPNLQILESGFETNVGSAPVISKIMRGNQSVFDKEAVKAMGLDPAVHPVPNEEALAKAWGEASQGYGPVSSIRNLFPDIKYVTGLEKFIKNQPIGGEATNAAARANRMIMSGKMTGKDFIEEIQRVRTGAYGALKRGEPVVAEDLHQVESLMSDYLNRSADKLVKAGKLESDAVKQLTDARTRMGVIHQIEQNMLNPVAGHVSPTKFLNAQIKRHPFHRGPDTSPVGNALSETMATAKILRDNPAFVGNSGTASRILGQDVMQAQVNPFTSPGLALQTWRNKAAVNAYLHEGYLGKKLGMSPRQNAMARRLMPVLAVGVPESYTAGD